MSDNTLNDFTRHLEGKVREALRDRIRAAVNDEVALAQKRVQDNIEAIVSKLAIELSREISVETYAERLVITVRLVPPKPPHVMEEGA